MNPDRAGIVVLGQTGQLARALRKLDPSLVALGRRQADFADPVSVVATVAACRPKALINAVAYTAVDRAETEPDLAQTVNAATPAALARWAANAGVPFLQVSTDYVFDGGGAGCWQPEDPTGPLGAYGRSKLAGEVAVRAAGGVHAILRTSWVFSAHGANFVKTMLRLGALHAEIKVVSDQIGGPTPAGAIAQAALTMTDRLLTDPATAGTYHFAGAPDLSWAGFARAIFAQAGLATRVVDIATRDWPTPARRPANSRLDCSSLTATFGIARPDWRRGLAAVLAELGAGT